MMHAMTGDYHYYRTDLYDDHLISDIHHVPVAFKGHILSGIWARIGRYGGGNLYVVAPIPREPEEQRLNYRASQYLREIGLILPVENVGCPEVTRDLCTLTKRYSDVDLVPRRQMLESIFWKAAAMELKRTRLQNERKGLSEWCKKGIPHEIEHLLHQFVGPTPTWKTWTADQGLQGAG